MTGGQRRPAGTLDQTFDADTLADLRKAVLAAAAAVGLPEDRAAEAMFAVHELAANAVRHGGGAGRAQLDVTAGSLRCQVSDTGPGGPGCYAGTGGADSAPPWPFQPGHGLWLVQWHSGCRTLPAARPVNEVNPFPHCDRLAGSGADAR
jgi:anti-sigma regulatory factor (Ser/Thr protein kinase)